ncbi:MAG: HAMP domain-containing histidine kinase [Acidobacteria bacterium]|nr:HAMP domain-containing histidine kinase [Acidobacteriota bacterium]
MRDQIELPGPDTLLALNRAAVTARLLSGLIHDINNALQVISGTLELLEQRTDMPAAAAPALDRLRSQSARATAALANVQLFTRAPVQESATVNLREIAEHSITLRAFAIRRAGLTIRLEAPADDYQVAGIRGQLQQAVLNLIANAEQALAGRRGSILVQLEPADGAVVLRVSDDGPGVTLDPPERAFGLFASTREPWEGAGLGLWAAREIAGSHGGTLTYERQPQGASFVLTLPRRTTITSGSV